MESGSEQFPGYLEIFWPEVAPMKQFDPKNYIYLYQTMSELNVTSDAILQQWGL